MEKWTVAQGNRFSLCRWFLGVCVIGFGYFDALFVVLLDFNDYGAIRECRWAMAIGLGLHWCYEIIKKSSLPTEQRNP